MRPTPVLRYSAQHAQHVAVQVGFAAWLEAGNRHAESDHLRAIESAVDLAADFGGHHEQPQRDQFDIFETPDRRCNRTADFRSSRSVSGRMSIIRSPALLAPWPPATAPPSPASVAPGNVAWLSTKAKRLRNFALVLRSACSGSTLTKRARFTSTNSRSPISPSSSSGVPFRALPPVRAALRPACRAPGRDFPNRSPRPRPWS